MTPLIKQHPPSPPSTKRPLSTVASLDVPSSPGIPSTQGESDTEGGYAFSPVCYPESWRYNPLAEQQDPLEIEKAVWTETTTRLELDHVGMFVLLNIHEFWSRMFDVQEDWSRIFNNWLMQMMRKDKQFLYVFDVFNRMNWCTLEMDKYKLWAASVINRK